MLRRRLRRRRVRWWELTAGPGSSDATLIGSGSAPTGTHHTAGEWVGWLEFAGLAVSAVTRAATLQRHLW